MKSLLKDKNVDNISIDDIIEMTKNPLVDMLVISGGESLSQGEKFLEVLRYMRKNINKPIRIDTNGSFPELVKQIKDENLADGFAVDIKYPYWLGDSKLLHKITGVEYINREDLMETMSLADEMPYSLFRTVKYPILPKDLLDNISEYIRNNFKSPHYINPYYTLNG
jgi:pyruvate formate lyase activating enzyme